MERNEFYEETERAGMESCVVWACSVVFSLGVWVGVARFAWFVGGLPATVLTICCGIVILAVAVLSSRNNPLW